MSGDRLASQAPPAALSALRRYRAERTLRRDFNGLRGRVLKIVGSRLRAGGVALDRGDLEACYATAWHGLYAAIARGEEIDDAAAWLVLVTFRRAIDEGRSRTRRGLGGSSLDASGRADGRLAAAASGPEAPELLADRERLRHLFEALLARMSPREREAVSLCYLQGLSRAEAAARMGVSPNRMRKLMDGGEGRAGVASKFGGLARTVGADRWCEQQGSLMRAYALGLLDPEGERHRLAVAHVRRCPACRRWVACLRGLAALLPPLAPRPPAGAPRPRTPRATPRSRTPRAGPRTPRAGPRTPRAGKTHMRLRARASGGFVPKLAAAIAVTATVGGGYALLVNRAPARPPGGASRTPSASNAQPATPPRFSLEPAKAPRSVDGRLRKTRSRRHVAPLRGVAARPEATPAKAPPAPQSKPASSAPPKPASPAQRPVSPAPARSSGGNNGEFMPEQVRR